MIRVPEFLIHKGAFTDVRLMHHMSQLGLLSVRKQLPPKPVINLKNERSHPVSGAEPAASPAGNDMAFLADVRDFPEAGVAERYKRPGLSVRQGQKARDKLVWAGMILEQVQLTQKGKVRVIRLTEKGKRDILNVGLEWAGMRGYAARMLAVDGLGGSGARADSAK